MTLAHFNCVVGTLHRLNPATNLLELVAQRGVPDAILDRVRAIPIGKGMAGLAAERLEPVQVCNLQTDTSGAAKPGAKMTEMEGSLSAPILVEGHLRGTIGIAMPRPHEFDEAERNLLMQIGSIIGEQWPAT
ncbi:MAG: GAF domain-containing protein [Planctomycetes bacterium]|nr:GAF domain-containing protein [Planctomycetota bacterium]